jgi:hypothetical protein
MRVATRAAFLLLICGSATPAPVFASEEGSEAWGWRETDAGPGWETSVTFPEEARDVTPVGDSLRVYAEGLLDEFRELMADWIEGSPNGSMDITFTREPSPEGFLCLMAWIWEYSGGAHGMSWNVAFVFDTEAGGFVDPVSLLGDSAAFAGFAAAARDTLLARFGTGADTAWIEEGTAPISGNYTSLLPVPDQMGRISGFRVFFAPYQVAPYVAGPQEVLIRNAGIEAEY